MRITKDEMEAFYKKHFNNAVAHCVNLGLPQQDAEDLVQSLMLEVFTKYNKSYIRNPKKFFAFLNLRVKDAKRKYNARRQANIRMVNFVQTNDILTDFD